MKTPEEIQKGFEKIIRRNVNPVWQFTTSEKIAKECFDFYNECQQDKDTIKTHTNEEGKEFGLWLGNHLRLSAAIIDHLFIEFMSMNKKKDK